MISSMINTTTTARDVKFPFLWDLLSPSDWLDHTHPPSFRPFLVPIPIDYTMLHFRTLAFIYHSVSLMGKNASHSSRSPLAAKSSLRQRLVSDTLRFQKYHFPPFSASIAFLFISAKKKNARAKAYKTRECVSSQWEKMRAKMWVTSLSFFGWRQKSKKPLQFTAAKEILQRKWEVK